MSDEPGGAAPPQGGPPPDAAIPPQQPGAATPEDEEFDALAVLAARGGLGAASAAAPVAQTQVPPGAPPRAAVEQRRDEMNEPRGEHRPVTISVEAASPPQTTAAPGATIAFVVQTLTDLGRAVPGVAIRMRSDPPGSIAFGATGQPFGIAETQEGGVAEMTGRVVSVPAKITVIGGTDRTEHELFTVTGPGGAPQSATTPAAGAQPVAQNINWPTAPSQGAPAATPSSQRWQAGNQQTWPAAPQWPDPWKRS